jgi:hypothetical protein
MFTPMSVKSFCMIMSFRHGQVMDEVQIRPTRTPERATVVEGLEDVVIYNRIMPCFL